MNWIIKFSQYSVGLLFIFSGLIKANDPLGFSYKLQEYFDEFAKVESLSGIFELFHSVALPLAVFLVVLESVLGVAIIARFSSKLTTSLLSVLIIFFTLLTFSTAYFGIVKSCGCFGDAIPLTPWESFYKDVVLSVLIFILTIQAFKGNLNETIIDNKDVLLATFGVLLMGFLSIKLDWIFLVIFSTLLIAIIMVNKTKNSIPVYISLLLAFLFTIFSFLYLPAKDFRAYAKEKSIIEGMKTADELGLTPPEYANIYVMKNTVTGEEFKINSSEYIQNKIWEDTTLKLLETSDETVLIKEGYEPPILDFSIEFNGEDMTSSILTEKVVLLVLAYDISLTNPSAQEKINMLAEQLEKVGIMTIGLSASSYDVIEEFRHEYQIMYPYCYTDPIVLKTMVRANPGLILLKEGVVVDKWTWRKMPKFEIINKKYLQ